MDQAVYETLLNVGNPDGTIRSAAEQRLKEFASSSPEFPVSLARLTVSQDISIPQRQSCLYLAAVTLKTYVTTHWSSRNEETFQGPEPLPECKNAVREIIVQGLADPESKIRVVSAYVVSKIAHDDFPEDWPNLLDIILSYLKANSADSVHGAMRVLLEMVKRDISIQQLPQIGPVLVPELYRIMTSDNLYSFRTRGRAVSIFDSCTQMLQTMRDDNPQAVDQFMAPILPQWMQAFHSILSHHVQGNAEKATAEYGLKMEVLKCIGNLSKEFSSFILESLPQFLEPVWNDLCSLKDRYVTEMVLESDGVGESFQDSDGSEIGFQVFLYSIFDFMLATCMKKTVRHLFVNNRAPTQLFEQMLYIIIVYLQITQEQEEIWLNDVNQYIADEDDYTYAYSARVACWDLLASLQDAFPDPFAAALQSAVQRHINESNAARAAGDNNWWKIQEASLCAVGRSADDIILGMKDEKRNVQFDIKSLFDHVIMDSMRATGFPFLQGRAFVIASELVEILPPELASNYVRVAVEALQTPDGSIPLKVSALRALNNYCRQLDVEYAAPYQVNIMECVCQLLPEATEETLMLLLQSLCAVIKIKPEVTAQYEHILTPAVLNTWKRFPTDSIIASYILDAVEGFAKNEHYAPALYGRCLPFLDSVFKTVSNQPVVMASAVDLLTAMIRYAKSPLPNEFTEQMFPIVMELGWNSTDEDILQSVQECLKQYIAKDCDHIIQWRDASGKSGLDYVIHFVARLLQSSTPSQSLFVGDLIITLIQKAGNNIAGVLPELLNAVLARLQSTDYQPFVQSLVMVFAHLIIQQQDTVYQFLCNTTVNGKGGLEILMQMWCDYFDSFSGYYSLKVSAIALSKVYLITDPRLQSLTVRGDIIADPNGGIVTRSKAKNRPEQYTAIPLHAKIIRLLVGDLANASATGAEFFNEDDNEGAYISDSEDGGALSKADFEFLSEMLAGTEDDDEENNEELKDDPIYQTDMRAYLLDFFRNCSAHNVNNFMELCQHHLPEAEKEILETELKK